MVGALSSSRGAHPQEAADSENANQVSQKQYLSGPRAQAAVFLMKRSRPCAQVTFRLCCVISSSTAYLWPGCRGFAAVNPVHESPTCISTPLADSEGCLLLSSLHIKATARSGIGKMTTMKTDRVLGRHTYRYWTLCLKESPPPSCCARTQTQTHSMRSKLKDHQLCLIQG